MIDILLPTYNGFQYLPVLLDSILNQTVGDVRIIVRDDGSKDNTWDVIRDYKERYPEHFLLVEDDLGNQGTSGSNDVLIKYVTSDYFMFCDQDDIWEPNKIEVSLKEMRVLESEYPDKPILVCSDACCVDENGTVTAPSFVESQKFCDVTDNYHKMLALNIVQGATALMNKKVFDYVKYIPKDLFHDWWVGVVVCYYGKVSYIHQPLLKYRQHSANVVGALNVGSSYLLNKLSHLRKQWRIYSSMYRQLPFKPSILKWGYYKFIINLRRL